MDDTDGRISMAFEKHGINLCEMSVVRRLADPQGVRIGRDTTETRPLDADGHGDSGAGRAGLVAPDIQLRSASVLDDEVCEARRNAMAIP